MTVVFSVIFPSNLPYFPSFLNSLENQTDPNFRLVLINDGVVNLEEHLAHTKILYEVIDIRDQKLSFFENRIYGLEKVLSMQARYIVFADTDDLFSSNRIAVSVKYLQKNQFICNDISLMTHDGRLISDCFWTGRISNNSSFDCQFIRDKNLIGFGNSAMRTDNLEEMIGTLYGQSAGTDWLFFSAAKRKMQGVFLNECETLYRQHSNNLIGKGRITGDGLIGMINSKIEHYNALQKIDGDIEIDELLRTNKKLLSVLQSDPGYLDAQVTKINSSGINFFWWEESNYIN